MRIPIEEKMRLAKELSEIRKALASMRRRSPPNEEELRRITARLRDIEERLRIGFIY